MAAPRDLRFQISDDEFATLDQQTSSLQDNDDDDELLDDALASTHPANRNADHHTIVDMNLRTLRFIVVVALALCVAFTYAFLTSDKLVVARLSVAATALQREDKVSLYNVVLGTTMFTAGKVFEIYTETLIFPTLHTYLHNCPLYPGDEPQRVSSKVKSNCIFWGLKTVVILMNVGTASMFVGQRYGGTGSRALSSEELLSTRQLLQLSPLVQEIDRSERSVFDSFLTGKSDALVMKEDSCAPSTGGLPWTTADIDYTSLSFGFARRPWSHTIVRHALRTQPTASVTVGRFIDCVHNTHKCQRSLEVSGMDLEDVAAAMAFGAQSILQSQATQPTKNTTIERGAFDLLEAIAATMGDGSIGAELATLRVEQFSYEAFGIRSVAITIDVPRQLPRSSKILCGVHHCVAVVDTDPAQRVSIQRHATTDFVTSAEARRVEQASDGSLQEIRTLSFALHRVTQPSTDLDPEVPVHVDSASLSNGSSHSLLHLHSIILPDASTQRLTTWLPIDHPRSPRPPTTMPCSPNVDAYVDHLHRNVFTLASPTSPPSSSLSSTTNTAALLFFTQEPSSSNLEREEQQQQRRQRRLADSTPNANANSKIKLRLSIPNYSAFATFAGCGAMVVLTVFVILRPTARVRLTPNTTPAAQYVQILTDDLYPNIVHKKRLRFVNGEVLPFNEYVVDSIVLRAKRDPTKKIYLNA